MFALLNHWLLASGLIEIASRGSCNPVCFLSVRMSRRRVKSDGLLFCFQGADLFKPCRVLFRGLLIFNLNALFRSGQLVIVACAVIKGAVEYLLELFKSNWILLGTSVCFWRVQWLLADAASDRVNCLIWLWGSAIKQTGFEKLWLLTGDRVGLSAKALLNLYWSARFKDSLNLIRICLHDWDFLNLWGLFQRWSVKQLSR